MPVSSQPGTKRKAPSHEIYDTHDDPGSQRKPTKSKRAKRPKVADSATPAAKTVGTIENGDRKEPETTTPAKQRQLKTTTVVAQKKKRKPKVTQLATTTTIRTAVGEDSEDATMADAPSCAPPTVVNGPISLQQPATGVTQDPSMAQTTAASTAENIATTPDHASATSNLPQQSSIQPSPATAGNGNVFGSPPPPLFTPWTLSYGQAHGTFGKATAMTMNWSTLTQVDSKDRIIYELRAPWNPKPPSWSEIKETYNNLHGADFSLEGIRKCFGRANKVVFAVTGVYFLGSSLGLTDSGIPIDTVMMKDLVNTGLILKPVAKSKKAAPKVGGAASDLNFDGEVFRLVILQSGTTAHVERLVSREIVKALSIDHDCILQVSASTFDRWYSCIAFGLRHTFPKRVYKLKQKSDGDFKYQDEGLPPVTIQVLLDTYVLSQIMGTKEVSDMIMDEIHKVLKREKSVSIQYQHGSICLDDPNDVVRFFDLQPDEIHQLWRCTKLDDPLRALIVDLWSYELEMAEQQTEKPDCQWARQASELHTAFARSTQRYNLTEAFANGLTSAQMCASYHNHGAEEPCYKSKLPSAKSIKIIDNLLDVPLPLHIDNIRHTIFNETGGCLDLDRLQSEKQMWDWESVRSIKAWIFVPMKGPQIRSVRPVFYDEHERDEFGRLPSHPGHKKPKWAQPRPEEDEYTETWLKAKHKEIPREARKLVKPQEGDPGEVYFDLDDEMWIAPGDFADHVKQRPGEDYHDYQRYRTWLWKQEGRRVPTVRCQRWRPSCDTPLGWKDAFVDKGAKESDTSKKSTNYDEVIVWEDFDMEENEDGDDVSVHEDGVED